MSVSSVPGRGSRFGVELPLVSYLSGVAAERRKDAPGRQAVLVDKFVLVVDDEADVRFGTETLLREWGCRTASAGSLEETRAALERELRFPDAVIADYRIDERHTGLDVVAAVREYTGEHTPGIIVTGEALGRAELAAVGVACALLHKPLAADELRRNLAAVLESATKIPADPCV